MNQQMEEAKRLIQDFCLDEYNSEADFSDLSQVPIAYTTITDDEIPIQVYADLEHFCLVQTFDDRYGEGVEQVWHYESLHDMIEHCLMQLDFDDLTFVPDEMLSKYYEQRDEMVRQELCEELTTKMSKEKAKFEEWLITQTPEDIIWNAYELYIMQDVLLSLRSNDLSTEQVQALLSSPTPLNDIINKYDAFESNHMKEIWDCVTGCANDWIQKNKDVRAAPHQLTNEELTNIIPIQEFRRREGEIVEGREIPFIDLERFGRVPTFYQIDRRPVYEAVLAFEEANNIKDRVIDENGEYTDKEFLYLGYDDYVAVSHWNELSPYAERFIHLNENEAIGCYLAQIYYGKQNGLSEKDIDYMIDEVNRAGRPYVLEWISEIRVLLQNSYTHEAISATRDAFFEDSCLPEPKSKSKDKKQKASVIAKLKSVHEVDKPTGKKHVKEKEER